MAVSREWSSVLNSTKSSGTRTERLKLKRSYSERDIITGKVNTSDIRELIICLSQVSPYSFFRAVTLSHNCGPFSSSPATTVTMLPKGLIFLTFRPSFGREKSNCLTIVTKNVCSSITLIDWSVTSLLHSEKKLDSHANLHPMQPLWPPEKVALY